MNRRATKRLRELFLANRTMPQGGVIPFALKGDWRAMKQLYKATPRAQRHAVLWEAIR